MDTKLRNDLKEIDPQFIQIVAQVHIMFRRYLERQSPRIDEGIEVLEAEKELEYYLDNTPDDVTVLLHGIVDLIYKKKGQVYIRDHKTGANKSAYNANSMEVEDQLMTYASIYWKMTGVVPIIEISWINSKIDYKQEPSNDQLFGVFKKTLTREHLEAYWNYVMQYVYHMRSVPAIRFVSNYKCKSCIYREPCMFSLRGLDTRNMIEANFIKVPRGYDYAKFTEIAAKKNSNGNIESPEDSSGVGGFHINFS